MLFVKNLQSLSSGTQKILMAIHRDFIGTIGFFRSCVLCNILIIKPGNNQNLFVD